MKADQDFLVLEMALVDYQNHSAFFPMPDWVKHLPEKEFLEWVRFSTIYDPGDTKNPYLRKEQKGHRVFLRDFAIFTDPWPSYTRQHLRNPWNIFARKRSFCPAVRGHIIDPFDNKKRPYGYGRSLVGTSFLLISSGPDGEREVDEKKFRWEPPNYGFDVPLKSLAYDPTNGLTSRGDICYLH